jgi:23S rRNA (guanosine2251-2'-O)-methyltransferase
MENKVVDRNFDRRNREFKEKENLIYGVRSVVEAIRAGREINKILIQKGMNKDLFFELKEVLTGKDFQLQFVPSQKLDRLTQANHQGVIAFVSPITYADFNELVDKKIEEKSTITLIFLDRITDVRNLGAIARSAACNGVDAIVVPSKGSALVTADAIKTSAGALNSLPVCKVDQLKDALFYIQQSGVKLIACTEKSNKELPFVELSGSVAFIFGSEEDGISNDLLRMADERVKIPMTGGVSSLNVSVSVGVVLYEFNRQKMIN